MQEPKFGTFRHATEGTVVAGNLIFAVRDVKTSVRMFVYETCRDVTELLRKRPDEQSKSKHRTTGAECFGIRCATLANLLVCGRNRYPELSDEPMSILRVPRYFDVTVMRRTGLVRARSDSI